MSVAFSPNGKQIVSGAQDNLIKIWHAATGAEVGAHTPQKSPARSPFQSEAPRLLDAAPGTPYTLNPQEKLGLRM